MGRKRRQSGVSGFPEWKPGVPRVVWESGSEVGDFRVVAVPDADCARTDGLRLFLEMRAHPDAMGVERWKGLELPEGAERPFSDVVLEKMVLWVARVALDNERLRAQLAEKGVESV